jgi:hypothetical protein
MDVRKADPVFRRLVIAALVAGTCAGALLIRALEAYRGPLSDWVRADAGRLAQRIELVFAAAAVLMAAPLVAMAAYLLSVGRGAVQSGSIRRPDPA